MLQSAHLAAKEALLRLDLVFGDSVNSRARGSGDTGNICDVLHADVLVLTVIGCVS